MSPARRNLKRSYRRYVKSVLGHNPVGLGEAVRNHARYMGYAMAPSFKSWIRAQAS